MPFIHLDIHFTVIFIHFSGTVDTPSLCERLAVMGGGDVEKVIY